MPQCVHLCKEDKGLGFGSEARRGEQRLTMLPAQEASAAWKPSRVVAQGPWSWLFNKNLSQRGCGAGPNAIVLITSFSSPRMATG